MANPPSALATASRCSTDLSLADTVDMLSLAQSGLASLGHDIAALYVAHALTLVEEPKPVVAAAVANAGGDMARRAPP